MDKSMLSEKYLPPMLYYLAELMAMPPVAIIVSHNLSKTTSAPAMKLIFMIRYPNLPDYDD
jgi:hypothetical protein